jgi:hypothetical protein
MRGSANTFLGGGRRDAGEARAIARRAAFACALIVAVAGRPGAAAAADPPLKVLRHLTFDVVVGIDSKTQTKVAGFDRAASGLAYDDNGSSIGRGTISVDVVGATTDGGLVVDVSEDAPPRRAPVVRVGITAKALLYDPSRVVTDEERTLLHFLARAFVGATELATGTAWTEDMSAGATSDRTTYTVKAVDVPAKTVSLDIVGASSASGPNGFDARTRGSMTYDTGVLVPSALELETDTNIQSAGRLTTVKTTLTVTLKDDSFRSRPAS